MQKSSGSRVVYVFICLAIEDDFVTVYVSSLPPFSVLFYFIFLGVFFFFNYFL